ncbi:hypothetical protein ABZZ17_33130 [Streptomyces sp. NPDC006512]
MTKEELVWSAVRMFAYGIGAMLLCGVLIIITVAFTVAVKERPRTPRE